MQTDSSKEVQESSNEACSDITHDNMKSFKNKKNKNAVLRRKVGFKEGQGRTYEQQPSECSKLPISETGKRKEPESKNAEEVRKSTRYTFTSSAADKRADQQNNVGKQYFVKPETVQAQTTGKIKSGNKITKFELQNALLYAKKEIEVQAAKAEDKSCVLFVDDSRQGLKYQFEYFYTRFP
jgi:hypothetical protein